MSFLNPLMLLGLLAAAVPIVIHLIHKRRPRPQYFGAIELVLRSVERVERRWRLRRLLLLLSRVALLAMLALAAAGPLLGREAERGTSSAGPERLAIVLDGSLSMRARYGGTSSFARALTAARNLVDRMGPEDQAVVVLAGRPNRLLVDRPTPDRGQLLRILDSLEPGHLKEGTALGDALMVGYDALNGAWQKLTQTGPDTPNTAPASPRQKTTAPRSGEKPLTASMVLVTDGENNIGVSPHLAAMQLKQANVSVFTIGIGENTGAFVRQNIYTRLDEAALRHISGLTNGQYYRARTLADFQPIYAAITEKTEPEPVQTPSPAPDPDRVKVGSTDARLDELKY